MKALSNSKDCKNCGSDHKARPLCVYENGEYCFSCGYTRTVHQWTVEQRVASRPEFPDSTNRLEQFSLEAQMWLAKYDVGQKLISKHKIHYCEDNSLIFPAFGEDGMLQCYQKRNMKERFITTSGDKKPLLLTNESNSSIIVLVEDFISAIRVNDAGYNSLCLFGTKLAYDEIDMQLKKFETILVWLDNDKTKKVNSGQEAAKKIIKLAEHLLYKKYAFSFDKSVKNIATEFDPKCFVKSKINKIIEGTLSNE